MSRSRLQLAPAHMGDALASLSCKPSDFFFLIFALACVNVALATWACYCSTAVLFDTTLAVLSSVSPLVSLASSTGVPSSTGWACWRLSALHSKILFCAKFLQFSLRSSGLKTKETFKHNYTESDLKLN